MQKKKKSEDKVVFSWRSSAIENKGKELFAVLKKAGANTVYQTISADADDKTVKDFLKNAYKNGVSVYMLEDNDMFHHPKLIADGLLSFKGNKEELALVL